jgi:hypothetical protein
MRGLPLLIELARRNTDERRSDLGEAAQAKASADNALKSLEDGLAREAMAAANDPGVLAISTGWGGHAVRRQAMMQARINELARNEVAARDALNEAFIAMKRLEIAQDQAATVNRLNAARRADAAADDRQAAKGISAAA